MTRYDFESKISLINKYVQLNLIKSQGKILHNEVPENDLFTSIIEDLKAVNELPEKSKISLQPVISGLKSLQEMQSNTRKGLDSMHSGLVSIIESMKTIREEQSNPEVSLESLIADMESFDEMQKDR